MAGEQIVAHEHGAQPRRRALCFSNQRLTACGCQLRYLPEVFPKARCALLFDVGNWRGGLGRLHDALYEFCRAQEGRGASPTAAIIDNQSVEAQKREVSIRYRSIRTGSTQARP